MEPSIECDESHLAGKIVPYELTPERHAAKAAFCAAYVHWITISREYHQYVLNRDPMSMRSIYNEKRVHLIREFEPAWQRYCLARDHWIKP